MRESLGVLAALFLVLGTAQARIGETETQILARYGKMLTELPARPNDPGVTKCYRSGAYLIAVTFLQEKSAREMLTKADNSKMSAAEIYKLLDARASGTSWNVQEVTGPARVTAGVQQWRSDGQRSRVAIYDSQTRALFITTQQFINLTNATKQRGAVRANTNGLGAQGRSLQGLSRAERGAVLQSLRRDPIQPAATPAK